MKSWSSTRENFEIQNFNPQWLYIIMNRKLELALNEKGK